MSADASESESNEPIRLTRQLRQRLEDLKRSGVDRLAIPMDQALIRPRPGTEQHAAPVPVEASPPPPPARTVPAPASPPRRPPATVPNLFQPSGFSEPPIPVEERVPLLNAMAAEVAGCTRCAILSRHRTQTVFGEGNPAARLMFIGEAPGETEDKTGRPFVGRAGQLLTDMITKGMGLKREDVFIANIVKCRPPENRTPMIDEVRNCLGYLERQIEIIRPEFLCLLGKPAAQALLETALPMGRIRGKWFRYKDIPTIATWHPSYLLRSPEHKKEAWADLQMLMKAMGISIPKRGES